MNDKPRPLSGVRDLFWLAVLALILAAWGWDRGRLVTRIEVLNTPATPGVKWAPMRGTTVYGGVDLESPNYTGNKL